MKIKLEVFGASRDYSDKDHMDLEVEDKASIDDLRNEVIKYIDKNFQCNENFIKVVKSSAFCSENNEIIIALSLGVKLPLLLFQIIIIS